MSATLRLTDNSERHAIINLPDAVGMLALKAHARTVRNQPTDVEDLWRCLEIAAADGVTPEAFDDEALELVRSMLTHELAPEGEAVRQLVSSRPRDAAVRLGTRLRALLNEVVG